MLEDAARLPWSDVKGEPRAFLGEDRLERAIVVLRRIMIASSGNDLTYGGNSEVLLRLRCCVEVL